MTVATALMPIPGLIDPVPVARAAPRRADGRIELVGLARDAIRDALEAEGLEPRQAKRVLGQMKIDYLLKEPREPLGPPDRPPPPPPPPP